MSEFETIAYCILIIVYGAVFYMAGKGDMLNLIPKMLLEKAKEIEESLVQEGQEYAPTVDDVVLPCKVGDTVYGQFDNYGKTIHECKVSSSKVCQFKDGSFHYFLDVEFGIIDPYYADGRLRCCRHQAVFGEDFGSWDRVFLTQGEAEAAIAERRKGG